MLRVLEKLALILAVLAIHLPATAQTAPDRLGATGAAPGSQAEKDYERGFSLFRSQNYPPALPLLQSACDGGDARGCYQLGAIFHNASADQTRDMPRALGFYEKACDIGNAQACQIFGYIYSLNAAWTTVEQDLPRAASLYDRGCSGGNIEACGKLGLLYELGQGVPKDAARMEAAYVKACDGGSAIACRSMGQVYRYGWGVQADKNRALSFYAKAIRLDPRDLTGAAKDRAALLAAE